MAWAVKQETKSPISKLVLLMIANYSDEKGECYPSQDHLAKLCQCTRVSVNRHIKELEKQGFLSIRKTKNGLFGYNTYKLNLGYVNNIDIPCKSSTHNTQDILINDQFNEFWDKCIRKVGKKKAKQLYRNIIKKGEATEDQLIKAMQSYSKSCDGTETKYVLHPSTWLNQARWQDMVEERQKKNRNFLLG